MQNVVATCCKAPVLALLVQVNLAG